MNQNNAGEQRAEYVAGLRALANLLEQHPELELPDTGRRAYQQISLCVGDREQMVAWAKVLTDVTEETKPTIHFVLGRMGGLMVKIFGGAERMGGAARTVTKRVTEYTVPPILAAVSE